jgi:hypothetical protein
MTTLRILVENDHVDLLKKLLNEVSFVKGVTEESDVEVTNSAPESALERIKKIQQEIGSKNLFKEIVDPSEWQREIRKEWDRDF